LGAGVVGPGLAGAVVAAAGDVETSVDGADVVVVVARRNVMVLVVPRGDSVTLSSWNDQPFRVVVVVRLRVVVVVVVVRLRVVVVVVVRLRVVVVVVVVLLRVVVVVVVVLARVVVVVVVVLLRVVVVVLLRVVVVVAAVLVDRCEVAEVCHIKASTTARSRRAVGPRMLGGVQRAFGPAREAVARGSCRAPGRLSGAALFLTADRKRTQPSKETVARMQRRVDRYDFLLDRSEQDRRSMTNLESVQRHAGDGERLYHLVCRFGRVRGRCADCIGR
jgi:hypothetical protein